MNYSKTSKEGFSLAEALITLLIVCLIVLMTMPILTKKKRSLNELPHGEWICEYNENGQHSSWSQDSPTPVVHDDYCEFIPPTRAQNFTIKAVGGGGGGGAGYSALKLESFYPGDNRTVDFLARNKYEIVMIGAGGGGGGGNNERGGTRGYGGGSGAAVSFTFEPEYNISYSLSVGKGGAGGPGDDGKHSGTNGSNGEDTTFGGIIFAAGGTGGEAVQYDRGPKGCTYKLPFFPDKEIRTGKGCGGKYAMSDPTGNFKMSNKKSQDGVNANQTTTGVKTDYFSKVVGSNMLKATYSYPYSDKGISYNEIKIKTDVGSGGIGGQDKNGGGTSGQGGYAAVKSDILVAGSAGETAQPVIFPVATINGKLRIYLGKGGVGGKNLFTSGTHTMQEPADGTSTRVGELFTAQYGKAGKNMEIYPSSSDATFVKGEDGAVSGFHTEETPSYGGRSNGITSATSNADAATAFGGGGGGGGARRSTVIGNSTYSNVYSGNGADGANGKVIIKW